MSIIRGGCPAAVMLLMLIAITIVPVSAGEATVIASDSTVTPPVLMPGERGLITVTLTNTARSSMTSETESFYANVPTTITTSTDINPTIQSVYLDGKGDITILGGNSQFAGDIGPGQSIQLSFLIEAPDNPGIYFPVLRVKVLSAESLYYPIPVNVNMPISTLSVPALILMQDVSGPVKPGDTVTAVLTLTNYGSSSASDVMVRCVETDPDIASQKTSAFHFSTIAPSSSEKMELSLLADRQAEEGIHEVPIQISYSVIDGSLLTDSDSISIDVRGLSDLSIASITTQPQRLSTGNEFDLIIRLENTGTAEARSVSATTDIGLSGSKEAFIGTIKPGNDAPAVFILQADRAGDFTYGFDYLYEDDWGEHTGHYDLHLNVAKNEDAIAAIVLLAVLAAAGAAFYFFYYRRRKEP